MDTSKESMATRFIERMLKIKKAANENDRLKQLYNDLVFAGATCSNSIMEAAMFNMTREEEYKLMTNRAQKLRRKFNEIDTRYCEITGDVPMIMSKEQPFQVPKLWEMYRQYAAIHPEEIQ